MKISSLVKTQSLTESNSGGITGLPPTATTIYLAVILVSTPLASTNLTVFLSSNDAKAL